MPVYLSYDKQEDLTWNHILLTSMPMTHSSYATHISWRSNKSPAAYPSRAKKWVIDMIIFSLFMSLAKHLSIKNITSIAQNYYEVLPLSVWRRGCSTKNDFNKYLFRSADVIREPRTPLLLTLVTWVRKESIGARQVCGITCRHSIRRSKGIEQPYSWAQMVTHSSICPIPFPLQSVDNLEHCNGVWWGAASAIGLYPCRP